MQRHTIEHLSVPNSEAYPTHCSWVTAMMECPQTAKKRNCAFTLREKPMIEECGLTRNPEAETLFKTWQVWSGMTSWLQSSSVMWNPGLSVSKVRDHENSNGKSYVKLLKLSNFQ